MFFAVLSSSAQNFTKKLDHNIDTFKFQAQEDTVLTVISPHYRDFVIALSAKTGESSIKYACPVGTQPVDFNISSPVYRFPSGDAEIIVDMKQGSEIAFSYASLIPVACEDVYVITKTPYNITFDPQKNNSNNCLIFASNALNVDHTIYSNIEVEGSDKNVIIAYYNEMVHGKTYSSLTSGKKDTCFSSINKPLIYKFNTSPADRGTINITVDGGEIIPNSLGYEFKASTVAVKPLGHFKLNYWLPVIGTAPSVVLLVSFAYGFFRIMRKKPVQSL